MLLDDCSHEKIGRLPSIVRCSLADIKERREAVVLTTEPAWEAVKDIDVHSQQTIYVDGNTKADMTALAEACAGEVIYGIGGGLAIDTAKYVAAANGLPLIALPTILSTDAFLTNATGVRENGCVHYLPSKAPDTVIIDMEVLCNAPAPMRASGAADVLSIATAIWDWQEAEKMGANPPTQQVTPQAIDIGGTLLQTLLDLICSAWRCSSAIYVGIAVLKKGANTILSMQLRTIYHPLTKQQMEKQFYTANW